MKAPQGGTCRCGKRYRKGQRVCILPGNGSPLPRLCHPGCVPVKGERVQPKVDGHQPFKVEGAA